MLELAQMAEVQASRYKATPTGRSDPLAQGDWRKQTKIEVAELAAIYGYSTADYTVIGEILRKKEPKTDAERKTLENNKKRFDHFIKAGEAGLKKLPVYKGEAVRCNRTVWQGMIDGLATDGICAEPSFMSAAKKLVPGFGEIVWHIKNIKTGKDISMFSLHQSEGEILFPPGSKFKFINALVESANGTVFITKHEDIPAFVTTKTTVGEFWFEQQ